jgi:hypothetical protein
LSPLGKRIATFAGLCAACGLIVAAYVLFVHKPLAAPEDVASAWARDHPRELAEVLAQPHVVFINTTFDERRDRLSIAPLGALRSPRYLTPVSCDRLYSGGKHTLCLKADGSMITSYAAIQLDEQFKEVWRFPLQGPPSRTRVSPDGRLGAVTVFVQGDSYAAAGFSTRTTLVDLVGHQVIRDLETFAVRRDGQEFREVDFNFWGVTFSPKDPDLFYVTLSTGGDMLLMRASLSRREMDVVHSGVECPSLSPDGTRVVYKKREITGGRLGWRLHVLDLQTLADVPLADERSVDDQAEWLDNEQVTYALASRSPGAAGSDLWIARADGTGPPRSFLQQAYSPSVVRSPGAPQ